MLNLFHAACTPKNSSDTIGEQKSSSSIIPAAASVRARSQYNDLRPEIRIETSLERVVFNREIHRLRDLFDDLSKRIDSFKSRSRRTDEERDCELS